MYIMCRPISMSCFNDLLYVSLIVYSYCFTLVPSYSGINAGEVVRLQSGGECDGLEYTPLSRLVAQ